MTAVVAADLRVEVDGVVLLDDVSFAVEPGMFVGVAGASGSGKTTLLRALAGLAPLRDGRVWFDDEEVTFLEPRERDVAMVFQQPALLPFRRVEGNVAFPLEIRAEDVDEIERRVGAELRAMRLEHLVDRRPDELSLGEAHLVSLARAMVRVPRLLLLDEPLAGVDDTVRARLRHDLTVLQEGYGVTTFLSTNDPHDVAAMCQHVLVLDGGRLLQSGPPDQVRDHPVTLDAGWSTGDLPTVTATVTGTGAGAVLVAEAADGSGFRLPVDSPAFADRIGEQVLVGIRPRALRPDPGGPVRAAARFALPGGTSSVLCTVAGISVLAVAPPVSFDRGEILTFSLDHPPVFDATSRRAIT